MIFTAGIDDRCRGMFQFYGANRTGRFSGRLVQLQNLPRNNISDLKEARELVKSGNYEALKLLFTDIPDTLSQLIRTAFIPKDGCKFFVADFSAIEARVIAWLADESWRMETFRNGDDIYCASASQMFGVPVKKHGINGHLRQKGKIAELACGYGGSVGAMRAMGAEDMGLSEEDMKNIITNWRISNPNIVNLWWDVDKAAKDAITQHTRKETHGISFTRVSGMLLVSLPSKRKLVYVKPKISPNNFNGESITYEGIGPDKKWTRLETYGPKLVENIVQAIARDILLESMQRLEKAGYHIVMHIHDEVVIEAPPETSLEEIIRVMIRPPKWAKGLLLDAAGFVSEFYLKD